MAWIVRKANWTAAWSDMFAAIHADDAALETDFQIAAEEIRRIDLLLDACKPDKV